MKIRQTPLAICVTLGLLVLYFYWLQNNTRFSDFTLVLVCLWNGFVVTNDIGYLESKKQYPLIYLSSFASVSSAILYSFFLGLDLLSCVLIGIVFSVWIPCLIYVMRNERIKRNSAFYVSNVGLVLIANFIFFQKSIPIIITCIIATALVAYFRVPYELIDDPEKIDPLQSDEETLNSAP